MLVLQVGEGIPAELAVHRQLAHTVPPAPGEDAFLLPADGQGAVGLGVLLWNLQV